VTICALGRLPEIHVPRMLAGMTLFWKRPASVYIFRRQVWRSGRIRAGLNSGFYGRYNSLISTSNTASGQGFWAYGELRAV